MIILDTNVLPRQGSLGGPAFALVRAIGKRTGHGVALPVIVIEESVAELDRQLRKEWDKANAAQEALAKFFPGYRVSQPDLVGRIEQWRADLQGSFTVLNPPPGAAEEALRREAHRIAPTRSAGSKGSGSGARDALIWLTVLDAHQKQPATGATYFVTNNIADFGVGTLLAPLQQEVDALAAVAPFFYLPSITALLEALATPVGPGPTAGDLLGSRELSMTVEPALLSIDVIDQSGWWPPGVRPAMTSVSLRRAKADAVYDIGGQRFAAVETEWLGVTSSLTTWAGSTQGVGGTSEEVHHYYTARLLLLVELAADGRVKAIDIADVGPFVYERSQTGPID